MAVRMALRLVRNIPHLKQMGDFVYLLNRICFCRYKFPMACMMGSCVL